MGDEAELPLWYRVLFAVAWWGVLAGPVLSREHERLGVPEFPYAFLAVALLTVLLLDHRRRAGLAEPARVRPALRREAPATAAVLAGGAAVVWVLALAGLPHQALSAAFVATGLAVLRVRRTHAAVRRARASG